MRVLKRAVYEGVEGGAGWVSCDNVKAFISSSITSQLTCILFRMVSVWDCILVFIAIISSPTLFLIVFLCFSEADEQNRLDYVWINDDISNGGFQYVDCTRIDRPEADLLDLDFLNLPASESLFNCSVLFLMMYRLKIFLDRA